MIASLLVALALGVRAYLGSALLQRQLERYVVGQIAQHTGLRADFVGFRFHFRPLGFQAEDLVLHGREDAAAAPLARTGRLLVTLRITSLLSHRVLLERVAADAPQVHIFALPDGDSNLPRMPPDRPAQPLFDLGVRDLLLQRGVLDLDANGAVHRIPLALHATGFTLRLASQPAAFNGALSFAASSVHVGGTSVAGALQLDFTLWPDDVRLDRGALTALGARVDFTGWLHHLSRPQLDVSYRFAGALPPALRVAGYDGLRAGTGTATGTLHWGLDAPWSAAATVTATGLRSRLPGWPEMSATAVLTADPAGLKVSRLTAGGAGARLSLVGAVPGWNRLLFDGRVEQLRLAGLWPALRAAQANPRLLSALAGLDGEASGRVTITGTPQDPVDSLDLTIAPAAAPGLNPLSGSVDLQLEPVRGWLTILAPSRLSLPTSSVAATGTWRQGLLALNVNGQTDNLGDFEPMLAAIAPTYHLGPLGGSVRFQLNLTGRAPRLSVTGDVEGNNLSVAAVQINQLSAAGALTPDGLTLTRGAFVTGLQRLTLTGAVGLQAYRLTGASPLDLQLTGANLDLGRVATLLGLRYPLVGVLGVQTRLTGTRAHPVGTATFSVTAARWQSQAVGSVSGQVRFSGAGAQIDNLTVALGPSRMNGSVAVDFDRRTYQVSLEANLIRLADVAALQSSRLAVTGTARVAITGAGSWDAPQATVRIATAGLSGNGESLGDAGTVLQLRGGNVSFQISDVLPGGSLQCTGQVGVSAPYPVQARLVVRDYDIDAWLRRFTSARLTGHSHIQGDAEISGPLADPGRLQLEASFDPVDAAISGLVIHNVGPIRVHAGGGLLQLESAHLVAPDTDLIATGSLTLDRSARLDAHVNGTVNLALVDSWQPNTHASGQLALAARVGGRLDSPQVTGTLDVRGAALSEENLPIGFDHIQGRLAFTGDRVQIDNLSAQTGGGSLTLSGFAMRTASGANYDLTATGTRLRIREQGVSATGNVSLRLDGNERAGLLSGQVDLTAMSLNENFDLALFIASNKTQPELPNPNSLLNHLRLDVHLKTGQEVEVATEAAHLQLSGDLRLRGTAAIPSIVGRVTAREGSLLFGGIEYQVDKGVVQFVNPFRIEPQLDLGLSATVQQYNVSLQISGPIDKLNLSYRSDPPLSSTDILALLATGAPTQADASLNQQSTSAFAAPSEQLLGRALDNVVAGRLHQLFGITQIQVNPNTGPTGVAGTGSSVTVQEQVSGAVHLTYTQNLSSSSQDIVQVSWTINRYLGIVLNRDSFGLYGLSFEFRHRAR